jgi:Ni,Fe-hydrogenase III small subunit
MTLLRLLNLLVFGPKVSASSQAFTDWHDPEMVTAGEAVKDLINQTYGGRCLRIRTVDAGSCNAEEAELAALRNNYYDLERFGLRFVASPRHADMLFVTGPVTRNLERALKAAYAAMPQPAIVVAIGDGACTGGIWKDSYAVVGPVENVIPVHIRIPGDPPSPTLILRTLLQALASARR